MTLFAGALCEIVKSMAYLNVQEKGVLCLFVDFLSETRSYVVLGAVHCRVGSLESTV